MHCFLDFLNAVLTAGPMTPLKNVHLPSTQYGLYTCTSQSCL